MLLLLLSDCKKYPVLLGFWASAGPHLFSLESGDSIDSMFQ